MISSFKRISKPLLSVLPALMVFVTLLGSFPASALSNTAIRQEVSITDGYLYAASGSYATSSEIAAITDNNYSNPAYYFEVDASTTSATNATVYLVNASTGATVTSVNVNGGNTYTRYRSAQFLPSASTTVEYKVKLGNESVGKGIIASRIVVLQNASTLNTTETQIEIGNNETYTSTATSSLASPKYWSYNSSKWDGNPTFYAEVTYANTVEPTISTCANDGSVTFSTGGNQCTGYITSTGVSTFTLPTDWNNASNTVEVIGGGAAGAAGAAGGSGGAGRGGGGGGGYAKASNKTFSSVVGYKVGDVLNDSYFCTDNTSNCSDTATSGGTFGSSVIAGAHSGNPTAGVGGGAGASASGEVGGTTFGGGNGGTSGGNGSAGGGGGGAAGGFGAGGNGSGATGGTGDSAHTAANTNGAEWSSSPARGSGGGGTGGNKAAGQNGGTYGAGGGGGQGSGNNGGTGQPGIARITYTPIATTTIVLQEDNGSFGSWTDKAYIVTKGAAKTPTRVRSSAFTPTNGRHYRLAAKNGFTGATFAIYDAKIIVDQGLGDISNTTYASKSFDASGQSDNPNSIQFSSDGTTMYILNLTDATVYQYTLSTAWDVSTASYASKSFSFASQATLGNSLAFKPDGTKMYYHGNGQSTFFEYTLSTAWDVSTASYASISLDVVANDLISSIRFNNDGTKMYAVGTSHLIYQYTLSTAYDISTATYDSKSFNATAQMASPDDFNFNSNGTKLYIEGGATTVYQYSLSTAFDISTASYDSVSYITSADNNDTDFVFSSDYSHLYFQNNNGIDFHIYEYNAPTSPTLFEPQYLLSPTKLFTGTGLQGYLTKWDSTEWSGVTNTYIHQMDAGASSGSAAGIYTSGGVLVTGSTVTSPSNSATSSSMTMPANGDLDVKATTNNNDVYANRIVVDSQVTVTPVTTLGTDTDPSNSTIAPGAAATIADGFTLSDNTSTDSVTAVVVGLGTGAHSGIQYVEITDSAGNFVYGTSTTPSTDTPSITLATAIPVTTTQTTYKVRITPLSHANMPAVPGATYTVTAKINSFTSTNTQAGSDTAGTTLTIDNQSPGDVSGSTVTAGDTTNSLSWTNPGDADLSKVMVLRGTASVTDTPTEGSTYATSSTIGATTAVCYGLQSSCTDTGLSNGTAYYYKVFTLDTNGNWSAGTAPTGSPATPAGPSITEQAYKFSAATSTYDGATWMTVNISDAPWNSITYGNGTFVAVADDDGSVITSAIRTSTNGVTWTQRSTPCGCDNSASTHKSVAYGNGVFVSVGTGADGLMTASSSSVGTWIDRTAAASKSWKSVAYGNGTFVAVADATGGTGSTVMTSQDSITWTAHNSAEADFWTSVAYGNGTFVAVADSGTNEVMYSTDNGATWTSATAASASSWSSVTYGNGQFVAVSDGVEGASTEVMTSNDGITWTNQTAASNSSWGAVTYGNGLYLATGYSGVAMTSPDAVNWTSQTSAASNNWLAVTYGNGEFVAVSTTGTTNRLMYSGTFGPHVGEALAATSTAATLYKTGDPFRLRLLMRNDTVASAQNSYHAYKLQYAAKSGTCDTSFTGETYADITDSTPISYYDNDAYVNNDGAIATTTDPIDTGRTVRYQTYRENNNFNNSSSTIASGEDGLWDFSLYDNGASGSTSYCLRAVKSTDAQTWTSQTPANTNNWKSLIYGNGTFVAIASTGSGNQVMTSPDGTTWTGQSTTGLDAIWQGITYASSTFVAVGYDGSLNGKIMTSSNGTAWTARTAAVNTTWRSVAYGNGEFVAVADTGAGNRVMTSTDGITWVGRSAPTSGWAAVAYGNGEFVAVSDASGGVTGTIMHSPDGINWVAGDSPTTNIWRSVTYGNGEFVAVGYSSANSGVMTSPDGITWTLRSGTDNDNWDSVTYGNGLFVAVTSAINSFGINTTAGNRVMTSANGITWTTQTTGTGLNQEWNGVAYGGGVFASIGSDGSSLGKAMSAPAASSNLDTYTTIPEIITATPASASITQAHYRWRNDDGSETGASFAAAEDTALTDGVYVGDRRRIRFVISNAGGTASNFTYQLEQASSSCTSWISVPNTESNGTHWVADASQYFLDGGATTQISGLTAPNGKSFTGGFLKTGSALTPAHTMTSSQFTEMEYTIRSTSAVVPGQTYCFRVTNAGSASGFTFSKTAEISVLPITKRPAGGGGNLGNESNGAGATVTGGNNKGGNTGNAGGESNGSGTQQGGGNSGGGGGGDTGFLFLHNVYVLLRGMEVASIMNPYFSIRR